LCIPAPANSLLLCFLSVTIIAITIIASGEIPAWTTKPSHASLRTADLLEIDGQDSFRVRSYRNAAEAIEALPAAGGRSGFGTEKAS